LVTRRRSAAATPEAAAAAIAPAPDLTPAPTAAVAPPAPADRTATLKRRTFHELHRSGCFVLPNPWDIGSARYLESLGFKALATTSAGLAWSKGLPDGAITREMTLAHLHELCAATRLPVNADFQAGFATTPEAVAESVTLAVSTGVAGLSIEDATGAPQQPIYDVATAVARLQAARAAIDRAGGDTLLVARADQYLWGRPNLDEIVARLKAYAAAGADCLYAPGITQREQISALVDAVAPKPLNLLVLGNPPMTVAQIEALGVRRISVGGALARVAWGAFTRAASLIAEQGSFDGFADAAPGQAMNAFFRSTAEGSG
jgi:2-methylisocitrate lyase-like PEP mutase family enzyme